MKQPLYFFITAVTVAGAAVCPLPATAAGPDSPGTGPRYGVTLFSANFMREAPDFPEELGNQLLMGTPVEIVGEESYWRQVVSPEPYKAWCVEMGVAEMELEELERYIAAPKYIVTAEYGHVFSRPSEKSTPRRSTSLKLARKLTIAESEIRTKCSKMKRICSKMREIARRSIRSCTRARP